MKRFTGIFAGTGAQLTIGLGFEPDWVVLKNIHAADLTRIDWHRRFAAKATAAAGIKVRESTGLQLTALTKGLGIVGTPGGTVLATASSAYIMPARLVDGYAGDMRAKTGTLVNAWTLGSSANATGNFNAAVDTTYVNVGSVLEIGPANLQGAKPQRYTITAITNSGSAANEVTLDRSAPSGTIHSISYRHEFAPVPVGSRLMAGIVLAADADLNASGELILLEAGVDEV